MEGGDWGGFGLHSGIQATGGYARVVIDGVVEPVYSGDRHSLASPSKDPTGGNGRHLCAPSDRSRTPFGTLTTLRAVVTPDGLGPQSPTGDVVFLGQGGGQFLGVVPVSTVGGATQAVLRTTALS